MLAALTVLAIAGCKGSDTNNTTKRFRHGAENDKNRRRRSTRRLSKRPFLKKLLLTKKLWNLKRKNALVEYSITDTNVKCLAYNAAPGTSADQLVIFEAPDEATAKTTLTQAQAYISDMAGVYELRTRRSGKN